MKKRHPKKLGLHRETLRALRGNETRQVVGGDSQLEDSCGVNCLRIRIPIS